MTPTKLLDLWRRLAPLPCGPWLFSKLFSFAVPYSGSVGPRIRVLEPGHAVVEIPDRRSNRNHLRSVHAIALVNLAEITSGLAMMAALPPTVRGIVTTLSMTYHKKARGTIRAVARVAVPTVSEDRDFDVMAECFDPEGTLSAVAQHECTSCPMVPVMLQRILELPEDVRSKYDTSTLRTVPVSGSALPGDLAIKFMDEFGDVIYNLYGSTEVAWATIATPADLRAAPGTAGKPPLGTDLRIYDENGRELPTGETGRIFVKNDMLFEGYTGGGGKDMIDGLMSSGDVGYLDDQNRLFVEGRDDEMIVSGGENVFPQEVEDLIARQDGVDEVAVIGVDDEKFGQRLKAYVVKKKGASVTEDSIKQAVKSNLARYKVPREIEFIDELPRNATGKVLKRELKEQHEDKEGATA